MSHRASRARAAAVVAGRCAAARGNFSRQHRGTDRRRLYSEAHGRPGPRLPMTRRLRRQLRQQLTLIATLDGSPVGFASLEGDGHDRHALRPSGRGRAGRRRHAGRRAGKARGRARRRQAQGRRQRHRARFLQKRGYIAAEAQHGDARRRMARQHHDGKATRREREAP